MEIYSVKLSDRGVKKTDKGLAPPVPIPAAAWLLDAGLIGLLGHTKAMNPEACEPA